MTAADACTGLRILLAPVFAWMLVHAGAHGVVPVLICLVAIVSDFADGRLARASGHASDARRIFDHGADILFLLPALTVLAWSRVLPSLLPGAAALAFALYLVDGRRRGRGGGFDLAPSRSGAAAGVANYAVALLASAACWLEAAPLARMAYAAGIAAAALNLAAALERVQALAVPHGFGTRA
jgi:phosphatidylglycerophosphate synthase